MKKLSRSLCLVFGLVLCPVVLARADQEPPRQYDIELLVFQNLGADDGGEVWPVDYSDWLQDDEPPETTPSPTTETEPVAGATIAPAPETAGDGILWLDEDKLSLNAEQRTLARSTGYRVLRHIGWRQVVQDRKQAQDIDIPAQPDADAVDVEGSVKVAVERYLHLYLDLKLIDPSLAVEAGYSGYELPEFRLHQHRRMRSGELHYFDHPKFGVLAVITPVKIEAEQPVTESSAATVLSP